MPAIPYTITTDTADKFEFSFPLHPSTSSALRVHQLLEMLIDQLSRDVREIETANGDVLQALAMAIAVRSRMIGAAPDVTAKLASDLVATALKAAAEADSWQPPVGHA